MNMSGSDFGELRGERRITIHLGPDSGLAPELGNSAEVVLGSDPLGAGLQVLIAEWTGGGKPSIQALRALHLWRLGKKSFPLVTVIRQRHPLAGGRAVADQARMINEPGLAASTQGSRQPPFQPSLLADPGAEPSVVDNWLTDRESATHEPAEAVVIGPDPEAPPLRLPRDQAARILQAAVDEPSGTSARRRIVGLLKQLKLAEDDDSMRPGIDNNGLFSRHYLTSSLPGEERWAPARSRSRELLRLRGRKLIGGLGFRIGERLDKALVLTNENDEQRAVALLLESTETFDAENNRLGGSPAACGLHLAEKRGTPWLILLRGDQIRLYATKPGTGVGSRSPVETWFQLDLGAIHPADAGYLELVFSATALAPEGSVTDLIAKSEQFAADLGGRLRKRVYEQVVPRLAVGVAEALAPARPDLTYAYRLTLRILFRLLFQAYAEDRGLLPYRRNARFDRHSLKELAVTFSDKLKTQGAESGLHFDPAARTLWSDLQTIWRAIDKGDRGLDIPAYDGGLFDADPHFRPAGTDLADMELGDGCVGPALRDLLVDQSPDGDTGPVDFRSLSVREFGTIYEGLLESKLSRAESDLTVDGKGVYVPAGPKDRIVVTRGGIYFHNRSGERKATGSYFTPEFAVEHLLDHALEPALAEHLDRVKELYDRGDQAGAAELFWDFRVADIAMGSGHFLIAAVDRIERGMRRFLAERPLASVNGELGRLHRKALKAFGSPGTAPGGNHPPIEPSTLLRRQIARRCIHGVDVNETAVELARVAVWIHTFVPGLPMSTLDHNLICGDSLTGIGTVAEALDVLDPNRGEAQRSLFSRPIEKAMAAAAKALGAVAAAWEADTAEVQRNRQALKDAKARAEPARRLFDAAVALRLGLAEAKPGSGVDAIAGVADEPEAKAEIERMQPVHMPLRFPQVFQRQAPGFDVLIGNPPWEEATVEELGFWTVRQPGLKSLHQKEQRAAISCLRKDRPDLVAEYEAELSRAESQRQALMAGPFPGMETGDPDLYKAFCWRFWDLARDGGAIGVVLPRSALSTKGSAKWRQAVLDGGTFADVTLLLNKGRWVFDTVNSTILGRPDHSAQGRQASRHIAASWAIRQPRDLRNRHGNGTGRSSPSTSS